MSLNKFNKSSPISKICLIFFYLRSLCNVIMNYGVGILKKVNVMKMMIDGNTKPYLIEFYEDFLIIKIPLVTSLSTIIYCPQFTDQKSNNISCIC